MSKINQVPKILEKCRSEAALTDGEIKEMFQTLALRLELTNKELYGQLDRTEAKINQQIAQYYKKETERDFQFLRKQLDGHANIIEQIYQQLKILDKKSVYENNFNSLKMTFSDCEANLQNLSAKLDQNTTKLAQKLEIEISLRKTLQDQSRQLFDLIISTPTVKTQVGLLLKQKQIREQKQIQEKKQKEQANQLKQDNKVNFAPLGQQELKQALIKAANHRYKNISDWSCLELRSKLELYEYGLVGLPSQIGNLTQLTVLDISSNNLSDVPDTIGNLVQLQELFFVNNRLQQLPQSLENLKNIMHLGLSNNNFTEFPRQILQLKNLTHLALEGNKMIVDWKGLVNLPALRKLSLSKYQIFSQDQIQQFEGLCKQAAISLYWL